MQKARHKRKVLNNPNRIPEHKNAKITQKYKNVIPIPPKNQNLRKKEKNKLSILKTYVELKIQERKEFMEGEMTPLREKRKSLKPRSMEGRRLKSPPIKDLAVATKQLSSMIRTGLPLLESLKIISDTSENPTIRYAFNEIDLSDQLRSIEFYFKAIPSGIAFYLFYKYLSSRSAVLWWYDRTLLKLPITKDLVTKSCLANFSRTLSSLNSAGVPILEALTIAKKTLKNRIFTRIIETAYIDIQAGNPMHKAFDKESVIPIMFTSMFRIGEETGELSEMITKLADFYEDEVSSSVKSLTSIMEPLMIIFVAIFVGIILIAMYLPMFSMMSTVG